MLSTPIPILIAAIVIVIISSGIPANPIIPSIKKAAIKHEWKVIVTCDHSTPCELKGHSNHPVPVLVYNPKEPIVDHAHRFNEIEARIGSLRTFLGKDFVEKVGLNR